MSPACSAVAQGCWAASPSAIPLWYAHSIGIAKCACTAVECGVDYSIGEYNRVQSLLSHTMKNDWGYISQLFDSSWNDTRDLLGTHTPEMERVAAELREKTGVLGVKVLGAGFGGNLLVCTKQEVDLGPNAVEHRPGKGFNVRSLQAND